MYFSGKIADLKNGCNNFVSLIFRVEKIGELRSFNSDGKIKTVYNATIFDGDTTINVTGWDKNRYKLKEKQVYQMENPFIKFNRYSFVFCKDLILYNESASIRIYIYNDNFSFNQESEIIIDEQTVIKNSEEKLEGGYVKVSNDGDHCKPSLENLSSKEKKSDPVRTESATPKRKSYDSRIIFPFR